MNQSSLKSKADWPSIRLDRERWEALKEIAEREDRPLASVLRRAVDAELERMEQAA